MDSAPGVGSIWLRTLALRGLTVGFGLGTNALAATMLLGGGFVRAGRAWLDDEIDTWPETIEFLGGVWVGPGGKGPRADLGISLTRRQAPLLFDEVVSAAKVIGVKPPEEIRLAPLPCCAVTSRGRNRTLAIGLPLLHVLTIAELRAVLAHELAHLARGDATTTVELRRWHTRLDDAIVRKWPRPGRWNPLWAWSRWCRDRGTTWLKPIARWQEIRADRSSAKIAGGPVAANALVKVALVQPLFKEVLKGYPERDGTTLFSYFRAFWARLPEGLLERMRLGLLASSSAENASPQDAHPPLLERLALLQSFPPQQSNGAAPAPGTSLLGDLEDMERRLHEHLYRLSRENGPSVFHRAGT